MYIYSLTRLNLNLIISSLHHRFIIPFIELLSITKRWVHRLDEVSSVCMGDSNNPLVSILISNRKHLKWNWEPLSGSADLRQWGGSSFWEPSPEEDGCPNQEEDSSHIRWWLASQAQVVGTCSEIISASALFCSHLVCFLCFLLSLDLQS